MVFRSFAVTAPGLESLAAGELRQLGVARPNAEPGGVAFTATDALLAAALLSLRTATRVLVRVAEFRATSFAQLERRAGAIPWAEWVRRGDRVGFRVTCRKSRLYHSGAVEERLAAAIVGSVPGLSVMIGATRREHPASEHPSGGTGMEGRTGDCTGDCGMQRFIVRVAHDICTISADAAGEALHRRGYRRATAKAPLRETLAAAMVMTAWERAGVEGTAV